MRPGVGPTAIEIISKCHAQSLFSARMIVIIKMECVSSSDEWADWKLINPAPTQRKKAGGPIGFEVEFVDDSGIRAHVRQAFRLGFVATNDCTSNPSSGPYISPSSDSERGVHPCGTKRHRRTDLRSLRVKRAANAHLADLPADIGRKSCSGKRGVTWIGFLPRNAVDGRLLTKLAVCPLIRRAGRSRGSLSDFGLVDAIESGIVKIPRLPVIDTTGRPDPKYFKLWKAINDNLEPGERLPGKSRRPKAEVVYREAEGALQQIASQWKERFEQMMAARPGQEHVPPVLILVCDNTDIAEVFYRKISRETEVEAVTEADVAEVLGEDD
jgi:hypothetical protein